MDTAGEISTTSRATAWRWAVVPHVVIAAILVVAAVFVWRALAAAGPQDNTIGVVIALVTAAAAVIAVPVLIVWMWVCSRADERVNARRAALVTIFAAWGTSLPGEVFLYTGITVDLNWLFDPHVSSAGSLGFGFFLGAVILLPLVNFFLLLKQMPSKIRLVVASLFAALGAAGAAFLVVISPLLIAYAAAQLMAVTATAFSPRMGRSLLATFE